MPNKYREFPFIVDLPHAAAIETFIIRVPASVVYRSCGISQGRPRRIEKKVIRREIVNWLGGNVGPGNYVIPKQSGSTSYYPALKPVRFRFAGLEKAALFKLFWYP